MNELICKITKSTNVLIKGRNLEVNLNDPLYAINWFSTKVEWMYHLYNFLATKSLAKIGGEGFFKGKITKTILDESSAKRELLLIVRYPSGVGFKNLMESTYFKIVSILRMLAVKKFSFGFTHKQVATDTPLHSEMYYVVHHFKTTNTNVYEKFQVNLPNNVAIKYARKMVAGLFSQQLNQAEEQIPNIMDGIVIFEAKKEAYILKMISEDVYQSIIKELDSSYIGTVNRVL